jgi:hypothetical protein
VRRLELLPGDMLLAASTTLETALDRDTLNALLGRGSDEALPELYLLTRDLPGFGLFAVTCNPAEDDDDHAVGDMAVQGSSTSATGESIGSQISRISSTAERFVETSTASLSNGGTAVATLSRPIANGIEAVDDAVFISPPPIDISRPIVRLRTDGAIGRSDYIRTTGPRRRFRLRLNEGKFLRVGGAVSLALLVVAFVPGLMREGRTEKLGSLVETAEMQMQAAQGQQDPAEKRRLLEDSRRLAAEALRLDPTNTGAGDLRQQASASLGAMDAVFDLGPMTPVTTLSRQVTGDVSIEALMVVAGNAYLLDSKGGRVLSVSVSGAGPPAVIFQEGETYRGTPAKKPLYFTWEGPSNTGRLLVLDAERKLFDVRPGNQPDPVPLRRTNSWMSVGGIAAYDGNLYVLDPRGNQVHRYLPAAQGFDSEPSALLAGQTGLNDAQGLAIDEDVFIYLKDGVVRRYRQGVNAGFNLAGIDRLPKAASDLVVASPAEEVYLADTSNKRIVVAGKDGTYRRQFVSNAFTDIRALAVDSASSQIYVVVGDALLTAPIVR